MLSEQIFNFIFASQPQAYQFYVKWKLRKLEMLNGLIFKNGWKKIISGNYTDIPIEFQFSTVYHVWHKFVGVGLLTIMNIHDLVYSIQTFLDKRTCTQTASALHISVEVKVREVGSVCYFDIAFFERLYQ